ncbi:MAG: GTP cyclohydrolase I FolE2 [Candidatus Omnitrophota bacterium]|nr:MAG: GTP cyclohydrolase I FolE2 [Candidatus Omnitrophota bacterium]
MGKINSSKKKYLKSLPDIQNQLDSRGITINRVGVSGVDFPILIRTKSGQTLPVNAEVDLFTSLEFNRRGTNLSRYIQTLTKWANQELDSINLKKLLIEVRDRAKAKDAYTEINFKYSLSKVTPVTKLTTFSVYDCAFIAYINKRNRYRFLLKVNVPVTSLCPCSRAISMPKGAHNQRAIIRVLIEYDDLGKPIWLEDLIPLIESRGSCPLWNLLKRPDEKYVTEYAYDHPKFVEDIARDTARALQEIRVIRWFKIKVTSFESIHTHEAVAYIERVKKGKTWRKSGRSLRSGAI